MTTEKTDCGIAVNEEALNSCLKQLADLERRVKEERNRISKEAREAGLDPKARFDGRLQTAL